MSTKSIISTPTAPAPLAGFAQGTRAGPFVFVSGLLPTDFETGLAPEARVTPGLPYYTVPVKLQTAAMLKSADAIVKAANASIADTVSIWGFTTDGSQAAYAREERSRYFKGACASTMVIVKSLPVADAVVTLDLMCLAGDAPFKREPITTDKAPVPPAGRYPQAVKAGPWVFTAGQIPTDFVHAVAAPAQIDPNFPYFGRGIKKQTAYILDNIKAVLEAAGSSLAHMVKANISLHDARDFQGFDEVWRDYFPNDPPARTVHPATTLFPGALLEIQTIAVTADGPVRKEVVRTDRAPHPTIHQSQAIKAGELVFLSGLLATDFVTGVAAKAQVDTAFPHHGSAIKRQTEYILDTAATILEAAGSSLDKLLRWQAFLPHASDLAVFQDTARARLDGTAPWPMIAHTNELIIPSCRVLLDIAAAA